MTPKPEPSAEELRQFRDHIRCIVGSLRSSGRSEMTRAFLATWEWEYIAQLTAERDGLQQQLDRARANPTENATKYWQGRAHDAEAERDAALANVEVLATALVPFANGAEWYLPGADPMRFLDSRGEIRLRDLLFAAKALSNLPAAAKALKQRAEDEKYVDSCILDAMSVK